MQQLDYVLILTASPMLGDDSPWFAISYLRWNIYIAPHTTVCSGRGHDLANPEPLLTKHEFSLLGAGIYPGVSCSHLQHCSSRICNPESFMLLVRYIWRALTLRKGGYLLVVCGYTHTNHAISVLYVGNAKLAGRADRCSENCYLIRKHIPIDICRCFRDTSTKATK